MSSMTNAVMQMLMGGAGAAGFSNANLTDRLGELARNDPRMAPIVQQLQQRLAARENVIEAVTADEPAQQKELEIIEPANGSSRNQELKIVAKRMFAELEVLRARNGLLADALGACGQCWGEDASCEYCGGDGRIGSFLISPKVFEQVVGPALRQLRQRPRSVQEKNITHKGEGNHAV